MECQTAFYRGKEKLITSQQKEKLDKMILTLEVKEKDLTIANQNLSISNNKRRIEVLTLFVVIAILLIVALAVYILRSRAYRRQLFRKEKELDQFAVDVRNWMEWKKEHQEPSVTKDEPLEKVSGEPLDDQHIQVALFTELRDAFDKQKLYLDPELNLKNVIRILGTNKKYLHQALSENSDQNFRAFINRYRVDEAKRVIKERTAVGAELNLSELYTQAGFNSTASFYRAFKSVTGLTPKEFAAEMDRENRNKN
jgi:AraC-like DNA-binding protein